MTEPATVKLRTLLVRSGPTDEWRAPPTEFTPGNHERGAPLEVKSYDVVVTPQRVRELIKLGQLRSTDLVDEGSGWVELRESATFFDDALPLVAREKRKARLKIVGAVAFALLSYFVLYRWLFKTFG